MRLEPSEQGTQHHLQEALQGFTRYVATISGLRPSPASWRRISSV